MNLKDTPIQRKLMKVILLTCGIVLSLMCVAYILFESFSFRQNVKTNVATLAAVIASNSTAALAFLSPQDAVEILSALKAEPHITAACLYDESGNQFATYPADAASSLFPTQIERNEKYWFKSNYLEGFQPVLQKNEYLGVLYIKADLKAMYSQLTRFAIIGLLFIICSLFIAYLLSKILQRTISEPIMALEQTAKIISNQRDYTVRAIKSGKDEVGALTDAFNQMLNQIQEQNEAITSFNQQLELKVTERTHELQEQKDFIETIINSSVDIIAVFDQNLNYLMLNNQAFEIYKKKKEEIIGKHILTVFPQTKASGMIDELNRALKGEFIHNTKYRSLVLNQVFENYYIPLKEKNGQPYGVLTIGHDISNITEAKERLELVNVELLKSNRDLEQFAYIASHDLQEPLRKIQFFSNLMGKNFNNEEKLNQYHEKIVQSATRMQQLIQDVLSYSRISNSNEAFVPTNLNQILENLKIDFELILQEKQASLQHSVLPLINGIPLHLTQLFSNLISNSLKYNDKIPIITITSDYLPDKEIKSYPKLFEKSSYVRIKFTDNGIGFEPQFSEQIFNIFQRLHGRQSYSGTGIGLAICKKIVENHHGVIFANGSPGEGATFTIILPV
ncbi:MAG: ATP-binding protein [Saprospiraceae bacterium]